MKCVNVSCFILWSLCLGLLSCTEQQVEGVWVLNAIHDSKGKIFDRNDPKYTLLYGYRSGEILGKKPNQNDSLIAEQTYKEQYRIWYDNETLRFTRDSVFITYGKGDPRHGQETPGTYVRDGNKIICTVYASRKHDKPFAKVEYILKDNSLITDKSVLLKQTWEFIRLKK